jgi:hypothetical protein
MSVDSVDRSSQYDALHAADEHERELVARHRKEIADLQKRHMRDVERIKKEYGDAMENLTHGQSQVLSEREQRHIKDVQNIQDMNRKRLASQKAEDEEKFYTTKDTLEGNLEQAKSKDVYDQDRLSKKFDEFMAERDEADQKLEERYREGSHEAYETQGKRLTQKDEDDKAFLNDQMHKAIAKKDQELYETRRNRDQAVGDLKTRLEDQRISLSERYRDHLAREQANYAAHLDNLEEGFQNSLGNARDKYRNKSEELADQYHGNFEKLKDTTNDRVGKQVDAVQRENQALQDKIVLNQEKDHIQNSIERDHLVGEYQNKYDEIEYRRQKAAQLAHIEKTRDIEKLQNIHNRDSERRTVQFSNKLEAEKSRNDINLGQQVGQAERERDLVRLQADVQKKRIADTYADKTVDQTEFFDDQMNSRQLGYEKMLGDQRSVWEKQRADELGAVQSQMAKENVAHQEKLMDTIANYEKQMAMVKNDYEKRLRHQAELFRDQTDKQVKALQVDREISDAKYQARLSGMKESYEREMDQLRKRQLAERQELAQKGRA